MALLLALFGCSPAFVALEPPVDEDDPIEVIPGDTDVVRQDRFFDPPGGTFVDPFELNLGLGHTDEAWYTTDGSLPTDADTPWLGPLPIDEGVELRVLVRDHGEDRIEVASWVRLLPALAGFTSDLPLVVLYADADIGDAQTRFIPVSLQVHDVEHDGRARLLGAATQLSRAAIKVRGSSTSYDPKRSWVLELRETYSDDDDKEVLLGMPADSDWVLYAPLGFDRALIRNALIYRLSNDAGRYAPRTRFAEVFAVGLGRPTEPDDYQGVYTVMERITASPDRVPVEVVGPTQIDGGYVFKRDRVGDGESGFDAGTAGGAFWFGDPLVYVEPDEAVVTAPQEAWLAAEVDGLADALASPDGSHDGRHYRDRIDVDAWIDHHILNLYPKNPDAFRLSAYMYKDGGGPIVAGPIWDFDRTMGCSDDGRADDPTWWDPTNLTSDTTPMFTYGWFAPLFDDPEFADPYWARWGQLLDGPLSDEHVTSVVDEMAAELEEAAPRNYERWSSYPPRGGSLDTEIELLKDWLVTRHAWIEACLAEPGDPRQCPGR